MFIQSENLGVLLLKIGDSLYVLSYFVRKRYLSMRSAFHVFLFFHYLNFSMYLIDGFLIEAFIIAYAAAGTVAWTCE